MIMVEIIVVYQAVFGEMLVSQNMYIAKYKFIFLDYSVCNRYLAYSYLSLELIEFLGHMGESKSQPSS